jgi:hypothetical protein
MRSSGKALPRMARIYADMPRCKRMYKRIHAKRSMSMVSCFAKLSSAYTRVDPAQKNALVRFPAGASA